MFERYDPDTPLKPTGETNFLEEIRFTIHALGADETALSEACEHLGWELSRGTHENRTCLDVSFTLKCRPEKNKTILAHDVKKYFYSKIKEMGVSRPDEIEAECHITGVVEQ